MNKIVNYDTFGSTKIDGNAFQTIIKLNEPLQNIKKVKLLSIELCPIICNIRSPYSTFHYSITNALNVTTRYSFIMPDKPYVSITNFLIDLNAMIVTNIQSKLIAGEIAPIFSVSISDITKLEIKYVFSTSVITFHNEGLLYYYLGQALFNTSITGSSLKTETKTFLNYYNINLDTYCMMYIHNIYSKNKSNNNLLCDFKIIIPTNSISINYVTQNSSFEQCVDILQDQTIDSLVISMFDRYGNKLYSIHDYSFCFEYVF